MRVRLIVIASLVVACAAPAVDGADAGELADASELVIDSGPSDAGGSDSGDDAGEPVPDAGAASGDGGVDLTCVDTAANAPLECEYLDLDRVLVRCDGELTFAAGWGDYQRETCPRYWTLSGRRCGTLDAVIAESECASRCRWVAATSVSLVHCGRRTGYITFVSRLPDGEPDPECPVQYEFSDGWYESVEAWAEKNACPDAGE